MHGRARLLAGTSLVAVAAMTLAACSSSGSSGPKAQSSTGPTAQSSTPSGSPIVAAAMMTPGTRPDNQAGIDAAVKAINAAGGIHGHPLQVKICDDSTNPNIATACARKAVSDSSVLAMVDNSGNFGTAYDPILEKASLASIGPLLANSADDKSPIVFPLFAGTFTAIESAAAAVKLLNAKKIGVPYIGVPAGAQLAPFISQIIGPMGAKTVGVEPIPITATDYSSFAAREIQAKPDVVVNGQTADMYTKFIKAVRQQGDKNMKFLSGVFDAQQIHKLFGDDTNIVPVYVYDHQAPGYQHFLSDMQKYNPGGNHNDTTLGGWIDVQAFAQVIKALLDSGVTNPTRKDILNYLNKQTAFNVEGLTGKAGVDYTKPNPALGGNIARLFVGSANIWLAQYVPGGNSKPIGANNGIFNLFNPNAQ